jgi:hypothetical protein
VVAAIDIVKQVRADLLNVPDQFNANNFVTVKNQLRTLTEAIIAMLEAQRD